MRHETDYIRWLRAEIARRERLGAGPDDPTPGDSITYLRGQVYALRPSREQIAQMEHACAGARWAWNQALSKQRDRLGDGARELLSRARRASRLLHRPPAWSKVTAAERAAAKAELAELKVQLHERAKALMGRPELSRWLTERSRATDLQPWVPAALEWAPAWSRTAWVSEALMASIREWRGWLRGKCKGPDGRAYGWPQFRCRGEDEAFAYQYPQLRSEDDGRCRAVRLPKIGWVRCRPDRVFPGRTLRAVISWTPEDGWSASVSWEIERLEPEHPVPGSIAAVALGAFRSPTVVDTMGARLGERHPQVYEQLREKLADLQRLLATQQGRQALCPVCRARLPLREHEKRARPRLACPEHGEQADPIMVPASNRWTRTWLKIRQVHRRWRAIRRDRLHKTTTALARQYEQIAGTKPFVSRVRRKETRPRLPAQGGQETNAERRRVNRGLADSCFFEAIRQLEYKCRAAGGRLTQVDPAYTAGWCGTCGDYSAWRKKSAEAWACERCGETLRAKVVQAENIMEFCDFTSIEDPDDDETPGDAR